MILYLNTLLVAKDSFSRCAREPITIALLWLISFGWVMESKLVISLRAFSNLDKSSNLEAPSASANSIDAPLELKIPCDVNIFKYCYIDRGCHGPIPQHLTVNGIVVSLFPFWGNDFFFYSGKKIRY